MLHAVGALRLVSAARAAPPLTPARAFSTGAVLASARVAAPKKRVSVRKGGLVGPRRTGGRRKGCVDTASSLAKASEHFVAPPNMSDLALLDSTAIAASGRAQLVAWTNRTRSAFDSFGLPRELKRDFDLQPRPRTVIRDASIRIVDAVQESIKTPLRSILIGGPGSGKSTYMLQALAHAIESKWVVIYIPNSIELVNSSTPYTFNAQHATYLQPEAAVKIIGAIATVNKNVLPKIKSTTPVILDGATIDAGTPLKEIIDVTLKSTDALGQQLVLELVLRSIAEQSEFPVLVAIDDLQALFSMSWYRNPDYRQMRSYELAVPRALLALLQIGVKSGAVLSSVSSTHSEFPVPAELLVALREKAGVATPEWHHIFSTFSSRRSASRVREPDAYTPLNEALLQLARGAQLAPIDVGDALRLEEAASLFDVLYRERLMWNPPSDEFFLSKFIESDGNVGTFEKSLRRTLV